MFAQQVPQIEEVQADDSVGVIIPPPELKTVIDKTAQYVAKNGPAFEKKIIETNSSEKFAFLQPDHPFHAYYRQCIDEFYRQAENEMRDEGEEDEEGDHTMDDVEQLVEPVTTEVISKKAEVTFRRGGERPTKDPLTYSFELPIPPSMTPLEFDMIKLMAQFTAKNGKTFLYTVSARENRNPQFDFLKLQHRHFPFFSKLTEIYGRILSVPKPSVAQDFEELNWLRFASNPSNKVPLLDKLYAKAEWDVMESERRRKQEAEEREEREALNMIDWHDFVVVDKIDFADEVTQVPYDENYEQYYQEQQEQPEEEEQIIQPEDIGDKVVKAPVKKGKKQSGPQVSVQYFKDPTTGQLIPMDKVSNHMKIRTIDPRWKEQKEREMQKFQSTNIATDAEISDQLSNFAKHRGDIFGKEDHRIGANTTGEQDAPNVDPSAIWDGHAGSADYTYASNARTGAPQTTDPTQQQLLQQQASMMAAQMAMSMMHPRPDQEDEPSAKRVKPNDDK